MRAMHVCGRIGQEKKKKFARLICHKIQHCVTVQDGFTAMNTDVEVIDKKNEIRYIITSYFSLFLINGLLILIVPK